MSGRTKVPTVEDHQEGHGFFDRIAQLTECDACRRSIQFQADNPHLCPECYEVAERAIKHAMFDYGKDFGDRSLGVRLLAARAILLELRISRAEFDAIPAFFALRHEDSNDEPERAE
jgi:hypothetical protein